MEDPDSDKFCFFSTSFRYSKKTTIKDFHKICCDHWGVGPSNKFIFYDDNGERCEDVMFGGIRTVDQLLESVMSKEFKEKDINPNAVRFQMLYLGDDDFQQTFAEMRKLKKKKNDELIMKQK